LAASALAVVLTGPVAEKAGQLIGLGGLAVTIWDIDKWPVLILVVSAWFAMSRRPPSSCTSLTSALTTRRTALAAVIILLVWLWISVYSRFTGYDRRYPLVKKYPQYFATVPVPL
jgi:membrane protein